MKENNLIEDTISNEDKEKLKLSKENPLGGIWDPKEKKWRNYKPTKGIMPNWKPFAAGRKKRVTIKERKFLAILSETGNLQKAYRMVYQIKSMGSKKLEAVRVTSLAKQVLNRLREKMPELVKEMLFEDITPEFVRKGLMNLHNKAKDDDDKHIQLRTLECMGRIHGMFTDKQIIQERIKETVDEIYKESEEDFPKKDERVGRLEYETKRKGVA